MGREELWRSFMKTTLTTDSVHKRYIKTLHTTTDRLRTVSWSDNSHPTGVDNTMFKGQTCHGCAIKTTNNSKFTGDIQKETS